MGNYFVGVLKKYSDWNYWLSSLGMIQYQAVADNFAVLKKYINICKLLFKECICISRLWLSRKLSVQNSHAFFKSGRAYLGRLGGHLYLNRSAESETIRNFVEFCSICSQDPWKFVIKAPPFIIAFLLQFGYDILLLMDVNEGMGYEYSDKGTYIQKSSTRFTAKKVALGKICKCAGF